MLLQVYAAARIVRAEDCVNNRRVPLGTSLSSLYNIPAVVSPLMPALATLT
jgi:hypothetical protein